MNGQRGIIGDLNEKWVKGQTRPYGNKELKAKKEKMRNENRVEGQTWPYTYFHKTTRGELKR